MAAPIVDAEYLKEIEKARRDLRDLMASRGYTTVMLCLAWYHAGTYDANTKTGGSNCSFRNMEELKHGADDGLAFAISLCEEAKARHPKITYADLFQLAGVVAVETSGGPSIEFVPGRKDLLESPEERRHRDAIQGAQYLRGVFYRMGLSDKDIVALSGSKLLGKADDGRSGFESLSWTHGPSKFDNSYFVELVEEDSKGSLTLPTEKALVEDPKFRHYVVLYAKNQDAFFADYAESHKKLSELGFTPPTLTLKGASKSSNILEQSVVGVVVAIVLVIFLYFYGIFSHKNQMSNG